MSTSFEDVLDARETAKAMTYPDEVEEKARDLQNHFKSLEPALDYVSTYRGEFGEVDGAGEYLVSYSQNLGSTEGIIDSLEM